MTDRVLIAICILSVGALASADLPNGLDYLTAAEREEARDLIPAFAKIERYLSSFPSHKVQQFMDLNPSDKLIELESTSDEDRKRNEQALKLFLSLPKATLMCNYEGYKILAQNSLAMEVDQYAYGSKKITQILRDSEIKHAVICRRNYMIHRPKSSGKTKKKFAAAQQIIQGLRSSNCLQIYCIYGGKSEHNLKISPICIKQLMGQLAGVHKTKSGSPVTVSAMKDSLREHLIDPCRDHYEQYRTVFAPAIHDEQIVPAEKGPFGAGLQDFRACEAIIRRDRALQRFVELEITQQ